jgi:hypothetical protein
MTSVDKLGDVVRRLTKVHPVSRSVISAIGANRPVAARR